MSDEQRRRSIVVRAMKRLWWLMSLPFVAFEVLGSKVVPAPVDVALTQAEAAHDLDLRVDALANTPPPNAG